MLRPADHRIGRMKNGSKMACGLAAFSQESTVFVSSGLDGGGKKRKKKTYTKPKLLRWQIWNDMDILYRYGSQMQSGSAKFSWVVWSSCIFSVARRLGSDCNLLSWVVPGPNSLRGLRKIKHKRKKVKLAVLTPSSISSHWLWNGYVWKWGIPPMK